ncbi:MAG: hypothetical protein K2M17_04545, partial [Bacilli bacterium]|nr:hypothetical protein [Bacilli bacterium]
MSIEYNCIMCGQKFSLSMIEQMGWREFNNLVHLQLPIPRIVKYFPNTISESGKNHSIEALKNGTVYLNAV